MKFLKSVLILALLTMSSVGAKADEHTFEVAKNLDIFHSLFTQLEMFYVDSIDVKRSMLIGIDAILEDLDPYTEYYSEEDMGDLKLMTTGKYGGIGSLIRMPAPERHHTASKRSLPPHDQTERKKYKRSEPTAPR